MSTRNVTSEDLHQDKERYGLQSKDFFQSRLDEEFKRSKHYNESTFALILLTPTESDELIPDEGELCEHISEIIRREKRATDVAACLEPLVFGVLLVNANYKGGMAFASRIQKAIENDLELEVSIIVTTDYDPYDYADMFLENHLRLLEDAKLDGPGILLRKC